MFMMCSIVKILYIALSSKLYVHIFINLIRIEIHGSTGIFYDQIFLSVWWAAEISHGLLLSIKIL